MRSIGIALIISSYTSTVLANSNISTTPSIYSTEARGISNDTIVRNQNAPSFFEENSAPPFPVYHLNAFGTVNITQGLVNSGARTQILSGLEFPFFNLGATGGSSAVFYFKPTGPDGQVIVNFDYFFQVRAKNNNALQAGVSFEILRPFNSSINTATRLFTDQLQCSAVTIIPCGQDPGKFSINNTIILDTTTEYIFRITSGTSTLPRASNIPINFSFGEINAFGSAVFRINPNQLNANLFGLSFSSGFTNPPISSIPEPTSWVFMIVGFGLIGWKMRRKGLPKFASDNFSNQLRGTIPTNYPLTTRISSPYFPWRGTSSAA